MKFRILLAASFAVLVLVAAGCGGGYGGGGGGGSNKPHSSTTTTRRGNGLLTISDAARRRLADEAKQICVRDELGAGCARLALASRCWMCVATVRGLIERSLCDFLLPFTGDEQMKDLLLPRGEAKAVSKRPDSGAV